METITLAVDARQQTGKAHVGRLRRTGKVPGIFYGPGKTAAPLCVDAREFHTKLAGLEGSHLIQLHSPLVDLNDKLVLLKEVQRHPVTDALLHVDFYEVDVTKPIEVTVSLHFTGKAAGVTAGGVLQPVRREITIECLPRDIPEFVEVDVSALGIHDTIHIEDLTLPSGVRSVYDTNVTVVTVAPPTVVEEEAPAEVEGAPTEEGAAPAEAEQK